MNNSMIDALTPDSIANDIRMRRTYFVSISFLIVEGPASDVKVYERFIDEQCCQVVPAYNKANALKVLRILENGDLQGFLAIVDTDFDLLRNISLSSHNLHRTDTHDLETMILNSSAFIRFIKEFGSVEKIGKLQKDVLEIVLDKGKEIGYLRLVSIERNLQLKFEKIDFDKFTDLRTLDIDIPKLIRITKACSNNPELCKLTDSSIQEMFSELKDKGHDLWHICCGHDLIEILAVGLRKLFGTYNGKEMDAEKIEKILRLSYDSNLFCETELYKSICDWENKNQPFRVFCKN